MTILNDIESLIFDKRESGKHLILRSLNSFSSTCPVWFFFGIKSVAHSVKIFFYEVVIVGYSIKIRVNFDIVCSDNSLVNCLDAKTEGCAFLQKDVHLSTAVSVEEYVYVYETKRIEYIYKVSYIYI